MQVRNSIKNIWKLIQEHFAIPFFLSVSFVIFIIYILKLQSYFFDNKTLLSTGLAFGLFTFFLWFLKLNTNNKIKLFIVNLFFPFFFLNSILNIIPYLDLTSNTKSILILLSIFTGIITFYSSDKTITENSIRVDQKKDLNLFKNFTKINKIPFLNKVIEFVYKKGWRYTTTLLFIVMLFLIIKLLMPLFFNGSYIDEYFHILSGLNLNEHSKFAEMYYKESYSRSSYISLLSGIIIFIFGKNIFALKFIPITLGIINFTILIFISHKFLQKNIYRLLLLFVYTISPFTILNHFYIRFNVFYEFVCLILLYLFIKLDEVLYLTKDLKNKYTFFIFLIASLNYILNNDSLRYLGILLTLIFIIYLLLYKQSSLKFGERQLLPFKFNKKIFISLSIVSIFLLLYFVDDFYKIFFGVLNNETVLTLNKLNVNTLFFNTYTIITILFLSSIFLMKKIDKPIDKLIIIIGYLLLTLHLLSSPSLKIIRGIFYFLPLYYLIAIKTLASINLNKLTKIIITILIIVSILNSYPKDFFEEPQIKNDLNYQNYNETFTFVKNNCQNSFTIALIHFPDIAYFYDARIDATNYIYSNLLEKDNRYHYENNKFITNFSKISVMQDDKLIEHLLVTKNKVCIITYSEYENAQRYISSYEYFTLLKKFNTKNLKNFQISFN